MVIGRTRFRLMIRKKLLIVWIIRHSLALAYSNTVVVEYYSYRHDKYYPKYTDRAIFFVGLARKRDTGGFRISDGCSRVQPGSINNNNPNLYPCTYTFCKRFRFFSRYSFQIIVFKRWSESITFRNKAKGCRIDDGPTNTKNNSTQQWPVLVIILFQVRNATSLLD